MSWSLTEILMVGVRSAFVLLFLVFGWRELLMLFRRPAKNMGTGLNRVWSVGRTTVYEAWAGRVWLLPILWLVASFVMVSAIRTYDESERMPQNIRMLLSSQELLLLVMMLVMACLSLPRERERKIIITNASKPLSRLEIVLGKMLGFSLVAALMVAIMGFATWGILHWTNRSIMKAAAQSYELQETDFNLKVARAAAGGDREEIVPPSEGTRRLRDQGALFAYNYVSVRPENLSIVGSIDLTQNPPVRLMKGGSSERAVYRFSPRLIVPQETLLYPVGSRAYFEFFCPWQPLGAEVPSRVQIRVTATRIDPSIGMPPRPVEKVVTLNARGEGVWEPDPDAGDLFSGADEQGNVTIDAGTVMLEIQCITPGVLVQIFEGAQRNPESGEYPDVNWNVAFRPIRGVPYVQFPQPNPLMRGFERREKQTIDGPKKTDFVVAGQYLVEQAVFRFSGRDLANVNVDEKGQFELGFLLDTYKGDNLEAPTEMEVRVKSMDSIREDPFRARVTVAEKRLTTIKVDKRFLGHADPAQRGDMIVMFACVTPDHSISTNEHGCRIELPQTPFWINLVKSELVLLLEAVLLIVIAVACSVRLGWPVAMLVTVACVLFGYFTEFILGLQQGGGLEALNYRSYGTQSLTFQFFDAVTSGIWKILGAIATFVPDFTIYRPLDYITNLQNMPLWVVGGTIFWTIVFVAPVVALAHLMFRKQELG